jgi:hypothetical protein
MKKATSSVTAHAEGAECISHLIASPIFAGAFWCVGDLAGVGIARPGVGAGTLRRCQDYRGWAWSQIKKGQGANFDQHCGTRLDPKKEDDTNWHNGCRKVSSRFLEDLLTRAPWRDAVAFAGVQIAGAWIVDDIDLESSLDQSRSSTAVSKARSICAAHGPTA